MTFLGPLSSSIFHTRCQGECELGVGRCSRLPERCAVDPPHESGENARRNQLTLQKEMYQTEGASGSSCASAGQSITSLAFDVADLARIFIQVAAALGVSAGALKGFSVLCTEEVARRRRLLLLPAPSGATDGAAAPIDTARALATYSWALDFDVVSACAQSSLLFLKYILALLQRKIMCGGL